MVKDSPHYKKTIFLCARRAMLENEMLLKGFAEKFIPENYTEKDVEQFNIFLTKLYDNDMFEIFMGMKTAEDYADKYDYRFLKDLENYADTMKDKIKEMSMERRKRLGY